MNTKIKMTLRDLNIGDWFTIGKGKTVWQKDTEQGMNNQFSYCSSTDFKKTRCASRKVKWERLFNQNIEVAKTSKSSNN